MQKFMNSYIYLKTKTQASQTQGFTLETKVQTLHTLKP